MNSRACAHMPPVHVHRHRCFRHESVFARTLGTKAIACARNVALNFCEDIVRRSGSTKCASTAQKERQIASNRGKRFVSASRAPNAPSSQLSRQFTKNYARAIGALFSKFPLSEGGEMKFSCSKILYSSALSPLYLPLTKSRIFMSTPT